MKQRPPRIERLIERRKAMQSESGKLIKKAKAVRVFRGFRKQAK
jgi:hypothetical protein